MASQKTKEAYASLDMPDIQEKCVKAMVVIIDDNGPDTVEELFEHIVKNFSYNEVVYLTSVLIAKGLAEALEKSEDLANSLRMAKFMENMFKNK
jgi:hypothetical protein